MSGPLTLDPLIYRHSNHTDTSSWTRHPKTQTRLFRRSHTWDSCPRRVDTSSDLESRSAGLKQKVLDIETTDLRRKEVK